MDVNNHFIEVPLLLNFTLGSGRIRSVTAVGGYLGYWILSHREGQLFDTSSPMWLEETPVFYAENVEFNSIKDNRFEAGMTLKTGIEFDIDAVTVFSLIGADFSFTDLNKNYQKNLTGRYDLVTYVEAGVLLHFGGEK